MKSFYTFLFVTAFSLCFTLSRAQVTPKDYGIWQTFQEPFSVSQYPELHGRLCNFRWKDLETSPGVWYWKDFDNDLTSRTKDGLPVIFMVYTEEDAPDWLYSNGVPKVIQTDNKGNQIAYGPYYADPDYKYYFKRMIQKVHQHVERMDPSVRNLIIGVQGCFGSTGDYIGYKGNVDQKYYLSGTDFSNLFQEFSQDYYDEYKNTSPKIALLSNPRNNGDDENLWVVQNCPGGWLKCGTLGKSFQLNDELDKSAWLYNILNYPQSGAYVRARSEIQGGNLSSGWWKKQPYKNMFAIMCYDIMWGLDWPNESGNQITDHGFDSAFTFFNKYSGQKDASKATNAMCALKDALDASDGNRFSASKYGTVSRSNQQRYKNIVNDYAAYGALLQDPYTATQPEMDNIVASGTNDVGWRLFPGNWDRYLHQIDANNTSAGYWNVQSTDGNTMYGRFARGFDVAKSKKALYFDVDDTFLGNAPLNGAYTVTIEITYLDDNGGSFKLFYDAKGNTNKQAASLTCGNTGKWKKLTVHLKDAYFGNRGNHKSDFSIKSSNGNNVIFSVVELSRPDNFAKLQQQAASVSVTNATTANVTMEKGLLVAPNPVQDEVTIGLKDNGNISAIAIYSQSGQLVLQKTVSAPMIRLHKSSIGAPGVYYIKVFAEKATYTTKLIVL